MRAALSVLIPSVAAPAGAQIRDGRRSGDLTRAETRQLRAESAVIGRVARQYRGGGPIAADTGFLEQRALMLRDRVATARNRSW